MKKTIIAVAIGCFAMASCQKENPLAPTTKTHSWNSLARESDPEEAKFDDMIETATIGLFELRKNETFKALVHDQIGLQFDGDDNVLLKTLDSVCTANQIALADSMEASLTSAGRSDLIQFIGGAINGFEYFNDTMYLQIFVPNVATLNSQEVPLLVENHTTEVNNLFVAYNASNAPLSVTTTGTAQDLVWVLSANESVGNNGIVFARTTGNWGSGNTPANKYYKISEFILTDKKESDFNGRAELCYAQYRHSFACGMVGSQIMVYVDKYNTGTHNPGNKAVYAGTGNPWNNSSMISTLWYERDVRKKFDRTETVAPGCSNMGITYSSGQSNYGVQTDTNPWTVDPNYFQNIYDNSNLTGLELKKEMN